MLKAFDHYTLGGDTDWSKEFLNLYSGIKKKSEELAKQQEAKRILNTKPSMDLTGYVGTYSDPLYGTITIAIKNNLLQLSNLKAGTATLTHWHYDSFLVSWEKNGRAKDLLAFILILKGKLII